MTTSWVVSSSSGTVASTRFSQVKDHDHLHLQEIGHPGQAKTNPLLLLVGS